MNMSDSRVQTSLPINLQIPTVTAVTAGLSIAAIVLAMAAPSGPDPIGADPTTLRCTNPISGATWDVAIDPVKHTADSFPADISARSIEWRDLTRGGRYEFDRASGELTVVFASSMGGTFLTDQCRAIVGTG
jgi:hypothetical protein